MYYNCHKVIFKCGGSHIDSPYLIKKKKTTINPKNTDNKCFQQAVTAALNYEQIESHPERVSIIKPLTKKYNWKGINYPSKIDDQKTFQKNPTTALSRKNDMSSLYLKY